MNSPTIKAPTDLVFYFPTSAETDKKQSEAEEKSEAREKPEAIATEKPDGEKKAAAKAKPEAKAKAAAKAKPDAKVKPATKKKAGKARKQVQSKGGVTKVEKSKAEKSKAEKSKPSAKSAKKASVPGRDKVVRDSFTMPKSDYLKIGAVKERCLKAGVHIKKSEILRAGLELLANRSPKQLLAAVAKIEAVKTGRPPKR